jgi:hypothetical protein
MAHKPKFLDLMRNEIRLNHFSICMEQAYVESVTGFVLFHQKRHPPSMSAPGIRAFLSHLAA